jgi:uncharacterized protein (TIGR02217 family)
MAFHEIRWPLSLGYGTRGGPGFSTSIVEGPGGGNEAVSRWPGARRHFDPRPGIKTLTTLTTAIDFYIARMGPAIGFRLKDLSDFTTAPDHVSEHNATDVYLADATGPTGQFQLRTKYVSGPSTVYRTIRKPVLDTVKLACDGNPVATSNYTVDTTTGLVTVTAGLTATKAVSAGCEFDVPVQFVAELDTDFNLVVESFNRGDLPNLSMLEMVGDVVSPERFNYGGSGFITAAGTTAINFAEHGRALIYGGPGAATWLLPDPTDLELGGAYFYVYNFGTSTPTVTLKTFDNVSTVGSLSAVGKMGVVCAYNDGTVNKWAALTT